MVIKSLLGLLHVGGKHETSVDRYLISSDENRGEAPPAFHTGFQISAEHLMEKQTVTVSVENTCCE